MTHLKIELSRNNEEILDNDSVVVKICEIIDNNNLDNSSKLTGRIRVPNTYDKYIDKINNNHTSQYNDLDVATDNVYIWFEDPNVETALKNSYSTELSLRYDGVIPKGLKSTDLIKDGNNNVTYIKLEAFTKKTNITSFNELPKFTNITTIINLLFYLCTNLTSVDLSNIESFLHGNNENFNNYFAGCTSLTNLGDTTKIRDLGVGGTFINCAFTSFLLGPEITKIPQYTFYNCYQLTQVTGGGIITTLGSNCFAGCNNLVTIPSFLNITSIGSNCFNGCSKLELVDLSTNLTSLPDSCFKNCGKLTTITGLSNITLLNLNVFDQCLSLTNINDLNWSNLTYVGPNAFNKCSNLQYTVDLSSVGGRLGSFAFNECSNITVTNLPISSYYGNSAFLSVKVPVNITIPKEVEEIDQKCFQNCTLIETILFELNSQINYIRTSCFLGCTNLQNIIFPEGLLSVGPSTFCGCLSLRYVEFPTTLTYLGANLLFGYVTNNACVTKCIIVFKSTTPPALRADNSYLWGHVFGKNNCVSNNAIDSINANTIYVPDGYVSDYQSSFLSEIESSGAGSSLYNNFMLFINNLIKPMSLLPST